MISDEPVSAVYPYCVLYFIIAILSFLWPNEHANESELKPHQRCQKVFRKIVNYMLTQVCLFYVTIVLFYQFNFFSLDDLKMAFLWALTISFVGAFLTIWKEDFAWSTILIAVPVAAVSHAFPQDSTANWVALVTGIILDQAVRFFVKETIKRIVSYIYSSIVIAYAIVITYAYIRHRVDGWIASDDAFSPNAIIAAAVFAVTKVIMNISWHFCVFKPRRKREARKNNNNKSQDTVPILAEALECNKI